MLKHVTTSKHLSLMLSVGALLGGVHQFWHVAIFSKVNSRYSYFGGASWGKEGGVCFWHNGS
jgi:hypothetical protein